MFLSLRGTACPAPPGSNLPRDNCFDAIQTTHGGLFFCEGYFAFPLSTIINTNEAYN